MKKVLVIFGILLGTCVVSIAQNSNANIGGVNFGAGTSVPSTCTAPSYFTKTSATQSYSVCIGGVYVTIGSSASLTYPLQGPNGGAGTPTFSFTGSTTTGFTLVSANTPGVTTSSSFRSAWTATQLQNISTVCFTWSSNGTAAGTADTNMCRNAAGVVAIGSSSSPVGTDTTGRLKASAYMSAGTKFTTNAGCTDTTLVGGGSVGTFVNGATGTCTTIITMGDTATATNGWVCSVVDRTTTAAVWRQTASNATTATIQATSGAVGSDVIQFSCIGY